MSICSPCTRVKNLPSCVTDIVIGTVAQTSTAHYVYFKNLATGRINRYAATSDGSGLLTVTVDEEIFPQHTYKVWVNQQSATNATDEETITIGAATPTCLEIHFYRVTDDSGQVNYTSQTLKIQS